MNIGFAQALPSQRLCHGARHPAVAGYSSGSAVQGLLDLNFSGLD